ncbi:putative Apple domain-containing protein [Seiridium cardinale]
MTSLWSITAIATLTVAIGTVGSEVGGAFAIRTTSNTAALTVEASSTISKVPATTGGTSSSTSVPTSTTVGSTSDSATATSSTPTSTGSHVPSSGLLSLDRPVIDNENATVTSSGTVVLLQYRRGYDALSTSGKTMTAWTTDECAGNCGLYSKDVNTDDFEDMTGNSKLKSSMGSQNGNCFSKMGTMEFKYCGLSCPLAVTALMDLIFSARG